jgi:hypothetical protein
MSIKKIVLIIIKLIKKTKIFPRNFVSNLYLNANLVIVSYNDIHRAKVLELAKKIKKENEMLLGYNEAYQIFMAVKNTEKITGEIAEVGTYKGGSAKLICEAKGNKTLHLFDTFNGLPELGQVDDSNQFHKGQFSASLEDVKKYLDCYNNIYFYKGLFPGNSEVIQDSIFSFVHLDLDLYEATKASLEFFYPRMNKGGIIISHDYINTKGVKKAFDEYFQDKIEPIIEMSGSQCLIVKL